MRRARFGSVIALAAAAALLCGSPAMAGKKPFLKGKIGKYGLKAISKSVVAPVIVGGQGFFVNGAGRKGFSAWQADFPCEAPGGIVAGTTYVCGGVFGIGGFKASPKGWSTNDKINLTVTSYDGTRMTGTIEGQLEEAGDTNPGDPPANVKLKFSASVLQQ